MTAAKHWADLGEVTFVAGIRFLFFVHRVFGRWPFRACLYPVVICHWLLQRGARAASLEYLRRVDAHHGLWPRPPGMFATLRHFAAFAEALLDKLLAVSGGFPRALLQPHGIEAIRARIARGEGGMFVTAHVGCLELCQAAAEWVPELSITVLVHTRHAERFNALLAELRPDSRMRLMQVTEVDAATAVVLAQRVEAGEYVAIVADRVPVGGGRVARASFLGHDAPFPVGAWVLASLLRCPVFLLSCVRERDRYALRVEPFRERVELPRGRRDEALQALAADYARWLETRLRTAPFAWFNFFRFWDQTADASRPA